MYILLKDMFCLHLITVQAPTVLIWQTCELVFIYIYPKVCSRNVKGSVSWRILFFMSVFNNFFPSYSLSPLRTASAMPSFKPSPSQIHVILLDTEIFWRNFVWLMNNGLETKWRHLWPAVSYCPGIYLESLRKSQINPAGYLVFRLRFERMINISRAWH